MLKFGVCLLRHSDKASMLRAILIQLVETGAVNQRTQKDTDAITTVIIGAITVRSLTSTATIY